MKQKFTLVIRPDGKAILSCEEPLDDDTLPQLAAAFRAWREKTKNDVLVLGNTKIITVLEIGLELPQGMKA